MPFGFSPFSDSIQGLFALPILSLAGLFVAWYATSWRLAAWRGWLFGVGSFGVGVSWVQESFQYSHITGVLSFVLAAGFIAFLSLFPAVVGAIAVRLPARSELLRLLCLFPAAWLLGEWLRGTGVSGFGWLQSGYALVNGPLAGVLTVVGVYGAGLLWALAGGTIAALCLPGAGSRWLPMVFAVGLTILVSLLLEIGHRQWTSPSGEPLDVALVQGNIPQDQKWKPEMRTPTLDRYRGLTREAAGADLIIWPETAVPGLLHRMKDFLREMAAEVRRQDAVLMAGIPLIEPDSGSLLNSVLLLGPEPGFYHKRHLVPFGEYLPFSPLLKPVTDALGIRIAEFSSGATIQPPLAVKSHQLGVFICYEVSFGSEVRESLPQAELLVTVSNDAWFGTSIGPHQHLQIARARALESGRWVLRATNTGLTVLVDPTGRIVEQVPPFEVALLRGQVVPRAGGTPFVMFGDWPALSLVLGLLGVSVIVVRRRKPAMGAD